MILVYAHITEATKISVRLQDSEAGKCAVLSAGDLSVLIHSREKLLEIASMLESAAQNWEDAGHEQ